VISSWMESSRDWEITAIKEFAKLVPAQAEQEGA
jgi:hypothetical protein